MEYVLPILGAVSLLLTLPVLLRLRQALQGTTLASAWNWAILGWFSWFSAWVLALFPLPVSLHDYLWYAVAVLGLCPPMTALGAKRPGSRVWAAFVVVPLLLVFAWPALVGWVHGFPPERLQLETPMLLGYGLVLIMGYGNYLGTRHSLSSLLAAAALGWLAWKSADAPIADEPRSAIGPTLLFVTAVLIGKLMTAPPTADNRGWDRVWRDFQDAFGIVWAKRIMDRINATARHEHWSAHLEMPGFVWDKNASPEQIEYTNSRIDHTARWLLRRFVDPEWIEDRLRGMMNDEGLMTKE